jgi:hypothetical protein
VDTYKNKKMPVGCWNCRYLKMNKLGANCSYIDKDTDTPYTCKSYNKWEHKKLPKKLVENQNEIARMI